MYTLNAALFLLLTCGWTHSQTFDCPKDPVNSPDCVELLYSYADNCGYYWSCTSACVAYLLECPPGLHFDPDTQVCDAPANVGCIETTTGGTTTTTTTQTTTEQSTVTTTSTTPSVSTSQPVLVDPTIIFAARTTNLPSGPDDSISFDNIEVDRHGDFDGQYFTVPTDGTYFVNLNAGFQTAEPVNFRFESTEEIYSHVRRDSTTHNGVDIGSRDYIYYFTAGTQLRMTQQIASGEMFSSTVGMETAIGVFSLHNSMEYVSVFSAGRNGSYSAAGVVDFNMVSTNVGNDWDEPNNRYIAPLDGTYYLSMGGAVEEGGTLRVAMTVNGATVAELYKNHLNNDDLDVFSRALVINLQAGDIVEYRLITGTLWANPRYDTYLAGFYYKPKYTPGVAWGLHKTSSWTGATTLNPVDYDDVLVNEQNVYNPTTHIVTIPYNGFYYIHLSAGASSRAESFLRLWKNTSTELFRLRRLATNHVDTDTLSRSGIFYFVSGDTLTVQSQANYEFEAGSTNQRLTSFQGFLIYSNE